MPKLTDTYALAYECCDRVLQETERFPTIDAIRERIGVNSPTTIKRAINDWTVAFARKHFDKLHRPDVPVALQDATENLWQLALKQASVIFTEQTEVQRQEREALVLRTHAAEEQNAALTQSLELSELHHQTIQAENTRLITELQEQKTVQDALEKNLLIAQTTQQQLEQQLAQEQAQWQQQHAQNESWYQRRIVEERDIAAEKWAGQVRHLETLNKLLEHNALQTTQQNQHLHERLQQAQVQVSLLESALSQIQAEKSPRWPRRHLKIRERQVK